MKVHVEWKTDHNATFVVPSTTLEDAAQFLGSRDEAGKFDGKVESVKWPAPDKDGKVHSVTINAAYTIWMPNWPNKKKQPERCRDEWDKMFKALDKHEKKHCLIMRDGIRKLKEDLEAMEVPLEQQLSDTISKALKAIKQAQKNFDVSTGHGTDRGVELNIYPECRKKKKGEDAKK